ncbi:hypothetical protein KC644_01675 [Candidatus Berkelbacteria bacterium]|nr:hypothetical protein [Candidatus Berkelbacteria bacterium]
MKRLLILLSLLLLPGLVNAKSTISLYPASVNIEPVPAGQVTLQQLTFTNSTGETTNFDVFAEDYRKVGNQELEYLPLGSTNNSLKGMIEFTPAEFELENGESQDIAVKISPPADAKVGRYQGVVFVGPVIKTEDDASVHLAGRVGALFGVGVGDPTQPPRESSQLKSFYDNNRLPLALAAFVALLVLGVVSSRSRSRNSKTKRDY